MFEAWHEDLETPVAVKIRRRVEVLEGKAADASRRDDYLFAHFKTEAVLGFRLRDPHVVRVLDFRLEGKIEYLVMEWLEGQSLRDLQDGRPMYWRRAAELVAKAAEAVASLHAHGWLHRDIKPDNFMVVGEHNDERVVLIDLGLVRHRPLESPIVSQLADPTSMIVLTPGFCAPEVYTRIGKEMDESPFSEASEVFALGVTLYKLLTARFPWDGRTPELQQLEIGLGVVPHKPSEFGARLPTDLENLLMRAIGNDPMRRPSSAQEFADALQKLLLPTTAAASRVTARPPEAVPLTPVAGLDLRGLGPSPALARASAVTRVSPAEAVVSAAPATREPSHLAALRWALAVVLLAGLAYLQVGVTPPASSLPPADDVMVTPSPSPLVVVQPPAEPLQKVLIQPPAEPPQKSPTETNGPPDVTPDKVRVRPRPAAKTPPATVEAVTLQARRDLRGCEGVPESFTVEIAASGERGSVRSINGLPPAETGWQACVRRVLERVPYPAEAPSTPVRLRVQISDEAR